MVRKCIWLFASLNKGRGDAVFSPDSRRQRPARREREGEGERYFKRVKKGVATAGLADG